MFSDTLFRATEQSSPENCYVRHIEGQLRVIGSASEQPEPGVPCKIRLGENRFLASLKVSKNISRNTEVASASHSNRRLLAGLPPDPYSVVPCILAPAAFGNQVNDSGSPTCELCSCNLLKNVFTLLQTRFHYNSRFIFSDSTPGPQPQVTHSIYILRQGNDGKASKLGDSVPWWLKLAQKSALEWSKGEHKKFRICRRHHL